MRENERSARPPSARKRPASAAPRSAIPSTWSEKTTRRTNTRIKRKGAKAVSSDDDDASLLLKVLPVHSVVPLLKREQQKERERETAKGWYKRRAHTTQKVRQKHSSSSQYKNFERERN